MQATGIPILLLDGGLGTTLTEPPYNQNFDHDTPLWSSHLLISSPGMLRRAQAEFVEAGADIVLTATYQASFEGFDQTLRLNTHLGNVREHDRILMQNVSENYMRSAVDITRDALLVTKSASRNDLETTSRIPRIALALGPLGATLSPSQEYSGNYPPEMSSQRALKQWHSRRLAVFSDDQDTWDALGFVAFETCKRTDEVKAIREVMANVHGVQQSRTPVQDVSTRPYLKKWWISTVWPDDEVNEHDIRLMVGAMLENSGVLGDYSSNADAKNYATPWAIGVNCTGLEKVDRIVQIMESCVKDLAKTGKWRNEWSSPTTYTISSPDRPWLVLYPDGAKGLKYDPAGMKWVTAGIDYIDDGLSWNSVLWAIVKSIKERRNWAGIVLGGCCKTGPIHIRKLREKIDER